MPDPIDYDDPCAVLAELKPAYYSLIRGEKAVSVRIATGNGTTKEVTYQKADVATLRGEIARLEAACAKKTGRSRRFAIISGGCR